jgi:quinol monooxygenase YgiN
MKAKRIKRIEWMEQDTEMVVIFEEKKGNLSYDSRVLLPANYLNRILCDLQKENEGIDPNSFLKVEQWSENEFNYIFEFSEIEVKSKKMFSQGVEANYRFIRA